MSTIVKRAGEWHSPVVLQTLFVPHSNRLPGEKKQHASWIVHILISKHTSPTYLAGGNAAKLPQYCFNRLTSVCRSKEKLITNKPPDYLMTFYDQIIINQGKKTNIYWSQDLLVITAQKIRDIMGSLMPPWLLPVCTIAQKLLRGWIFMFNTMRSHVFPDIRIDY